MKSTLLFLFIIVLNVTYGQKSVTKQLRHFLQSDVTVSSEIQYGNNPAAGHYANAGDANIYYEVYGKGEPIVILHGGIFGSTFEMYRLIDSLSKDYQVIAVSTRGYVRSELGKFNGSYRPVGGCGD